MMAMSGCLLALYHVAAGRLSVAAMQTGDADVGWFGRWVAAEQGRFIVWLPVFAAAGVVLYDALRAEPPGWAGASAGGAALLAVWLARSRVVRAVAAMVVAMALGMASAQVATWRAPALVDMPARATVVSGTVRAVEQLPQGRRVTIDRPSLDDAAALPRAVRVRLKAGDEVALATGDTIRVRALLQRPASPAYPGAWDLQRDAFYQGLGGFGFALNPAERVAEGAPAGSASVLQRLREAIAGRVAEALEPTEGAIATTLLTGSTSSIPEADRAAFRDSGLAHLLAIAGLHIGIVMAWVFFATRLGLALSEYLALHWPLKTIAAVAALVGGGAYLLLTGAHVPIIRSFAMASLVTLGVIVGRRALSLRGLAIAMAALVLMAPQEVLGVSFQMSFSAVLALIAGYEALRPALTALRGDGAWWRRLLYDIAALVLTSALAGTASAPFGAYHFGHVQLYYVVANMLAVPLTALWVMPMGMLALLAMPLGLEEMPLVAMGWGIDGVLAIGRLVAGWPAAVLAVPHMPSWGLAVLSIGLAWLGIWRTRLRLVGLVGIAAGIASPMAAPAPDVLVSADARLIGIRTPAGVYLQTGSGASRFTRDAWLQLWAADHADQLPAEGSVPGGAIECARGQCTITLAQGGFTLLRGAETCAAPLLISAEPIRQRCAETIPHIDRFSVWREGAHAVWFTGDGPFILTDRAYRGLRPWVLPLPTRTRMPPGLPMAPAEDLPPE